MTNVSSVNNNQYIIFRQNQTQPKNIAMSEDISKTKNVLNNDKVKKIAEVIIDPYEEIDKKNNEFISNCTDGKDDGKLSFGEKVQCLAKGFSDHFTEGFKTIKTLIKEHPKETLATVSVCIITAAFNIAFYGASTLMAGISIGGICLGVVGILKDIKNIIKGVKQAKNSTSDAEAKQAYSNIGNNTADFAQNALLVYSGCKGFSSKKKILYEANYDVTDKEALNNMENFLNRFSNGKLSSEEIDYFKEAIGRTPDLANDSIKLSQTIKNFTSNLFKKSVN